MSHRGPTHGAASADAPVGTRQRAQGRLAGSVALGLVAVGATAFYLTRPAEPLPPSLPPAPITSAPASPSLPASPTPGRTPTRTPTAGASATPGGGASTAPASLGTLPDGVRLLHEGEAADGDTSAWEASPWGDGCPGVVTTHTSFGSLVASRNIVATAPEWGASETLLVFESDAAAQLFLDEVRATNAACARDGADPETRTRTASDAFDGAWDAGLALRSWDEHSTDGGATWGERPGASLDLVVRRGRAVTLSSQGGEFLGDTYANSAVVAETRRAIDALVPSLCTFTAAGC